MSYNIGYHYQAGGSLPADAPSYVVREADDELFDGLLAGEFCYVLNSRQMGKSSLRVRTMKRLQDAGVACSSIDLTGIGSQQLTPKQWYRGLIQELVSCFELNINRRQWLKERDDLTPVQQFGEFIRDVLLVEVDRHIVLLVDEIDSLINLDFPTDDFFALIRNCYNKRAENPAYHRLTFALFGVATPPDLIQDKHRTPFNIGRAIELPGFKMHEVEVLETGLVGKADNPQAVLREILSWTGGQPFLTQKICKIWVEEWTIAAETETEAIETLVRSRIIENWESQDEPEHLRTIRDRVLRNEKRAGRLLGLHQKVLEEEGIDSKNTPIEIWLRLTGLVYKTKGKIEVYNRVYERVFDKNWVRHELSELRPYSESFNAWVNSGHQDKSRLLQGKALQNALLWTQDKSLSDLDYRFLNASQDLEKVEIARQLKLQEEESRILAEAHHALLDARQKARTKIRIATVILSFSVFVGGMIFYSWPTVHYGESCVVKLVANQLASAREDCLYAIKLNPKNKEAHYTLGQVYERLRNFEKAERHYKEAVNLGFLAAYSELARIYLLKDDCDRALDLLRQVQQAATLPEVKYAVLKNIGWGYLCQWKKHQDPGSLDSAEKYLQDSLEIDNGRASSHCLLAQVIEERDEKEIALHSWKKCKDGLKVNSFEEEQWILTARQRLQLTTQ